MTSPRGRHGRPGPASSGVGALSSADHGEVTVVAGDRQVTPSLVGIASPAERLSKPTESRDHSKPVSSDLARARTSAIAAAAATTKATLDDSVKRMLSSFTRT